ncbi:MAG: beta strand repeat-containing protein, partial [Janthinobacterium lividum]
MLKNLHAFVLMLFLSAFSQNTFAQFPYTNSFTTSSATGVVVGGTAYLTAGDSRTTDTQGNGYLRLTSNANSQAGYAYVSNSFPSTKGISTSFEYFTYGGTGADGISFFLFDASVTTFRVGDYGGSLGYSYSISNGLSKGYLGIGLDEFGNFSASGFGPGGTGVAPNSVTIRGAWDDSRGGYYMLNTTQVSSGSYGFTTIGSSAARAQSGATGYRKVYIDIIPNINGGYNITVKIQHDAVSTPVTIVNNLYYSKAAPANLKFGFAASTGGSNNYHEIRNVSVTLPASSQSALTTPTQSNQTLTTCSNNTGTVNISSGFVTTNTPNGSINTASVDLDPTTTGIQTTYTVASKGTFTSDGSGNITFTPLNSTVSGTAVCNFTVADNYGATSNTATLTATINTAPALTGSQTNVTCNGSSNGSATVVASNGKAPYTYNWSPSGGSTATASNLSPGTYTVTVTDANGCSSTRSYTITQPAALTATTSQTNVGIYGGSTGSAAITVSGGTAPYTYLWSPSGGTAATASNLSAGTYTVTTTDVNGCTINRNYTITQPAVSTNSNLSNFTISSGTISPAFAAGTTSYSASVNNLVSSITVTPTTSDAYATITVNGVAVSSGSASQAIALSTGSNTITTVVTAQDGTTKTYNLNVTRLKDSQTITFNSISTKTYGDADFDAGATTSSNLAVTYTSSDQTVATIVNNKVHIIGTGTVNITATQAGNNDYNAATTIAQNLTVNKAPLTITATNQTKTYGTANPDLTAGYTGFVNSETSTVLTTQPTFTTPATITSAVGSYPINVTGAVAANYQISYVNGSLSVYPGIQTITFTASSKTYGDPDFTINAVASSGLPVTYSSNDPAIATIDNDGAVHIVAAGKVIISALQTGNGNYVATTRINQQITINKAPLTITADNQNKNYGDQNPVLTVSYDGFVNNETVANVTVQPTVSTTATTNSAVGTYPITVDGAASNNYNFTYINGVLAVNQITQTLTFAAPDIKTYGDADFSLNATVSSGLPITYISSDSTVATVNNAGVVHILSAGNATITASQAGNNGYIATAAITQNLTVNKASLTLTADDQTVSYGAAMPTLTFHGNGFVNGENQQVLTTQPVLTTTATATSEAGTYPITIANADAANYIINYAPGTLTISPAVQTIAVASPTTKIYGDANFNLNATSNNTAFPLTYISSNPALATVDASGNVHILGAGTVTFTISKAGNNNYASTNVTQIITINQAQLIISVDNQTRAYGAVNPAFTVSYNGFVNAETAAVFNSPPTLSTTANINSPAGNYPINASDAAAANYVFTYMPGTLTVGNPMVSGVSFTQNIIYENQPAGTLAGTLSATSPDPNTVFTYTFLSGMGSADNNSFTIQGNKILAAKSFNFEQQASYSILVRATNQYGLYFDQQFTIQISDVNEAPTLAAIATQLVCNFSSAQKINLTGI